MNNRPVSYRIYFLRLLTLTHLESKPRQQARVLHKKGFGTYNRGI